MEQQTPNPEKKLTKVDWIAIIGGIFITQLIFKMGSFGLFPALIIGFGSYWLVKKVASFFLERNSKSQTIPQQIPTSSIKQPKSRKPLLIIVGIIVVIGIIYFLSSDGNINTQPTDKSSVNSQVDGNLYRNTKYKFRVKFPDGWEIKTGDGPSIVQKAVKGNNSLSIGVKSMDMGNNSYTIKDILTLEELKISIEDSMKKQYPDIKVLDFGETKIDNVPAYWIKYSMSYSTMDITVKGVNTQYQVLKGDNYYFITAGSSADEFDSVESTFAKSLSTFVFEDY